jgi:hypothetical protein
MPEPPLCEMVSHKQAEYLGAIAKRGASDALKVLGLNDPQAADDIRDIRDLLRGLRVLKKAAWTTAFSALGRIIGWAILIALAAPVHERQKRQRYRRIFGTIKMKNFLMKMIDSGNREVEAHLVLLCLGVLTFIGLSIYHVVFLQRAFDPSPYGQGLGCLLAGGGRCRVGARSSTRQRKG